MQSLPIPPPPPNSGLTFLEWVLLCSMGIALVAVAGFITWVAKSVIPHWLKMQEERAKAQQASLDKQTAAMEAIPAALGKFEASLASSEARITERISQVGSNLRQDIHDTRYRDLEETVRGSRNPPTPPSRGQ